MARIVAWVTAFAEAIGGPGLFVVAFLDSSFLSLPEINDILVVTMVVQDKDAMAFSVLARILTMGREYEAAVAAGRQPAGSRARPAVRRRAHARAFSHLAGSATRGGHEPSAAPP